MTGTIVISALLMLAGTCLTGPLCRLMGASETFYQLTTEYLFWYSVFIIPSGLSTALQGFCRNDGSPGAGQRGHDHRHGGQHRGRLSADLPPADGRCGRSHRHRRVPARHAADRADPLHPEAGRAALLPLPRGRCAVRCGRGDACLHRARDAAVQLGFVVVGFTTNISSYLYSTKRSREADVISILRSFVVNTIVILLLPRILGGDVIWHTFGIAEAVVLLISLWLLKRSKRSGIVFN